MADTQGACAPVCPDGNKARARASYSWPARFGRSAGTRPLGFLRKKTEGTPPACPLKIAFTRGTALWTCTALRCPAAVRRRSCRRFPPALQSAKRRAAPRRRICPRAGLRSWPAPGRLIGLALRHAHDFVEQRDVEHIGHKPRADAHQPVGAGLAAESTADPAGSTAVIFTSGFRSFR